MKHGWPWKFIGEVGNIPSWYGLVHHDICASGSWCLPVGIHWIVNKYFDFKVRFVMRPGKYDKAIFEGYGEGYHKGYMDGVRAITSAANNGAFMQQAKLYDPEMFERIYGKKGDS